jgi:O-antigen/teichoic acid export membrane protein
MLHSLVMSDAGLLAASQYIAAAIGFLTTALAARLLGAADYGSAALVMAYPTLLWGFVSVKTLSVTTRYLSRLRAARQYEELKSICKLGYGVDLGVALVTLLLVVATGEWVARYFLHLTSRGWLMILYAASFPIFSLVGTSWAILLSWKKFRVLALLQLCERLCTSLLVVGLLWVGLGLPGMVLGVALGQVVAGFLLAGTAARALHKDGLGAWWRAPLRHAAGLRKELMASLGWNYVTTTFTSLLDQAPLLLLGRLRGAEEAGFYRLAATLVTAASYLETALSKVAYPTLSVRWGEGATESLYEIVKQWTARQGTTAAALVVISIPVLPVVTPLIFGPGYGPAVVSAQLLLVGVAVSTLCFWLNPYYYTTGEIGLWAKVYGVYTISTLLWAWFWIPSGGLLGIVIPVTVGKIVFTAALTARVVRSAQPSYWRTDSLLVWLKR